MDAKPREVALSGLATRQHGVVARWQLDEIGLQRGAVARRIRAARLHRIHRGVYAVGHRRLSREGLWMASVLACGPTALLSHRSAAALWGIRPTSRTRIDVLVPGAKRSSRSDIEIHGTGQIHPRDRAREDNIPVTSVARTLVDLTALLTQPDLARTVEQAERLRLLDARRVIEACERRPGIRTAPLLALLRETAEPHLIRSELERRFLDLCAEAGLPTPSLNVWIEGYEVDVLWEKQRLIVELDGHEFHRSRHAFERDRERDAALQVAGHRVVRITWLRLRRDPESVIADLTSLLRAC